MRHTEVFEPIRNEVRGEPYPIMNKQHQNATQKWDIIERRIGFQDKMVLDIGTSEGYSAIEALELGALFALGIDNVQWLLDVANGAKEHLGFSDEQLMFEKIDFLETNVETLESLYGRFDIVLCLGVLHHFPLQQYARQLKKVCALSSHVIVIEMWVDSDEKRTTIREDHREWTNVIPSNGWLTGALNDFGFTVLKRFPIHGNKRALWICKRTD